MAKEIPEQMFVGQVSQKAVIEHEGKILISRDKGEAKYGLPGGRIHVGERVQDGLRREVQEEIGAEILVGRPFYTDIFIFETGSQKSPGVSCFIVAYEATLVDPLKPFILAPDEIEEVLWISKEDIDSIPMWDEYKRTLKAFFESK